MDWMVWGSDPGMGRDFSLLPNVQTGSQALPVPYSVTNGGFCPRGSAAEVYLHSAVRLRGMCWEDIMFLTL